MPNSICIRPRARLDIVELAVFLGERNAELADRFLNACESTFQLLADSPGIGGAYPTTDQRLENLSVFRVSGFPNHVLFYYRRPQEIEIVRVLHGARDIDFILPET
ncbi:Plasmid stabilization system protein [Anatilimnocola aggregata]|uniref:Plasmid stabilization system protein n=1 Tax=Anatilimnocola aggregata TaxID=2528021 RepID=A0A517YLI2_9BACT|nr:type II toxin-antitoxin system RelE/ParE family toxin [Anatilimnocola aggregata]QDU31079.1 Plasmid stabilization system protein [Anatilimnocola aggregata]